MADGAKENGAGRSGEPPFRLTRAVCALAGRTLEAVVQQAAEFSPLQVQNYYRMLARGT